MYHTNKINQALIKENLKNTGFSSKDLQTAHYTPTEQKIVNEIERYHKAPWIKLSNEYIAYRVGCSVRTVIRATNKFHKNGFITKYQEHRYTSNSYILDHKNKKVIQCEYVTPNLRSSLNINLFINLNPTAPAREGDLRVFKKTRYPKKGERVITYKKQWPPVAKPKEKPRNKDGHSPAVLKTVLSPEEERLRLRHEIESCEIYLANPEKYFVFCLKESIKRTEKRLVECLEELIELERNSNEKQRVSNQYNTNRMQSYSA